MTSLSPVHSGLPRAVDLLAALAGLILLSPLLVVIALLVRVTSRGPALFRQVRVGLSGKQFTLYKFRTMTTGAIGPQITAGDDARITGVGRLLRTTKLDELPELWNVLRGQMALVGPRPEVPKYVDLESLLWKTVLSARPGITDPVTLRLRNEEALMPRGEDPDRFYREVLQLVKLRGYAEYLCRRTWRADLAVLMRTALAVVAPSAAAAPTLEDLKLAPEELFRLQGWPVKREAGRGKR